jgi:puromycin-sensitive aminopeptidase
MLFRASMIRLLGGVGKDKATREKGVELFKSFMANPSAEPTVLHPDLRQVCYSFAVGSEDAEFAKKAYDQLFNLYLKSDLSEEKRRCLLALGASKDPATLVNYLNMGLSDKVRGQDIYLVVMSVASNHKGRDIAWKWFQDNVDTLRARFNQGGMSTVGYIISSILTGYSTLEKADEVQMFFSKHSFPAAARKIAQSLETVRNNAARLKRDVDTVGKYLLA